MRQYTFLIFFLFFTDSLFSQNQPEILTRKQVDEFWSVWNDTEVKDSLRLNALSVLNQKYYYHINMDSSLLCANLMYETAMEKNLPYFKWAGLTARGVTYSLLGNHEQSEKDHLECINLFHQGHLDSLYYIYSCNNLGLTYKNSYQDDKALEYFHICLNYHKNKSDEREIARVLQNLGQSEYYAGNAKKGIGFLEESLVLYTKINHKQGEMSTSLLLADSYYEVGNYKPAIDLLIKTNKYYEEIGNDYYLFMGLNIMGHLFAAIKDYQSALDYYNDALIIVKKINQPLQCAVILTEIEDCKQILNPVSYLTQSRKDAIEILEKIPDRNPLATILKSTGDFYADISKVDSALYYYEKSLSMFIENNNVISTGDVYNAMGEIYYQRKQYSLAEEYVKKALEICTQFGIIAPKNDTNELLYKICKKLNKPALALNYYEEFIILRDSVLNLENQRELISKESKYEYEKQALADSLQFAQQQQITQATVQNQRLGLIAGAFALLFLLALAYAIYKSRQRAQAEADRVKELDAFKSKFYTNITHEFRTPLTVILGMIQQIKENPKKNLDEGVTLIERNGKNLLNQINQILDLSKLETKSFNLNPVTDDLVSFVRYAAMSFQSNANSQNLSLRFFTPLEKLTAQFDPDAMQKIVQNLVSNALKFTPSAGEVKVYLTQNGDNIELKVQDTGVGIAEAELPHIFDRFYQVENPADKTQEGTGIGLAYVQELVRVMKGNISVESQVGVGTEFVVTLPLVVEGGGGGVASAPPSPLKGELRPKINQKDSSLMNENTRDIVSASKAIAGGSSPSGAGGAHGAKPTHHSPLTTNNSPQLLIIEDNPDVVAYLKNCLADQYQIDIAYNGKIGIEKAVENIPDLIITDVMMPEVGGYEVCDTLKNDERTSHIPIIMLTAKADMASKIAGLKRGADVYLSKPFDKEELLTRMEMMVERQRKLATYFANALQNGVAENATETIEAEVIEMEDVFIQKVKSIVEKNYRDEGFGLPQLCSKIGMSRSQLFRKMKALIGASPSGFIRDYRLTKAKELLEKGEMNVSEVAWETGFTNLAHFSKVFQEKFGMPPSAINK